VAAGTAAGVRSSDPFKDCADGSWELFLEWPPSPPTALGSRSMALAAAKEELLHELAEAATSVPRAEQTFYLSVYDHGSEVNGGGFTTFLPVLEQDIYDLRNEGLLTDQASFVGGDMQFTISDDGWEYVAQMRGRGEPMARVEAAVFSYIDGETFQGRHPDAYAKWRSAYSDSSLREVTPFRR
jgi:hypothetical protein